MSTRLYDTGLTDRRKLLLRRFCRRRDGVNWRLLRREQEAAALLSGETICEE
jgi:hypothetical protein